MESGKCSAGGRNGIYVEILIKVFAWYTAWVETMVSDNLFCSVSSSFVHTVALYLSD